MDKELLRSLFAAYVAKEMIGWLDDPSLESEINRVLGEIECAACSEIRELYPKIPEDDYIYTFIDKMENYPSELNYWVEDDGPDSFIQNMEEEFEEYSEEDDEEDEDEEDEEDDEEN